MTDIRIVRTELGADAARILQAYRHHAQELPSSELDQRILAMAAAASGSIADIKASAAPAGGAATPRRTLSWMRYAASVAVVVIGAGLTWRLVDEGPQPGRSAERVLVNESRGTAPATQRATTDGATAGAASGDAAERVTLDAADKPERLEESSIVADPAPMTAPIAPAIPVDAGARGNADAQRTTALGAAARATEVTANPLAETAAAPPKAVMPPAVAAAPPASAAVAQTHTTESVAKRARISPLDPQVWLDSIRALRDSGHADEARISLREWRLRYPRNDLPADLRDLLEHAALTEPPAAVPPR